MNARAGSDKVAGIGFKGIVDTDVAVDAGAVDTCISSGDGCRHVEFDENGFIGEDGRLDCVLGVGRGVSVGWSRGKIGGMAGAVDVDGVNLNTLVNDDMGGAVVPVDAGCNGFD